MKRKFRELYYCSYSTLDCCPYGRFSRKINFSLWRHRKKRIGQKPNQVFMTCLKTSFTGKKSRKTLFDGKSKGPLLARAVLNNEVCLSEAMFSNNVLENLRENLVRILQNQQFEIFNMQISGGFLCACIFTEFNQQFLFF